MQGEDGASLGADARSNGAAIGPGRLLDRIRHPTPRRSAFANGVPKSLAVPTRNVGRGVGHLSLLSLDGLRSRSSLSFCPTPHCLSSIGRKRLVKTFAFATN